MDFVTHTASNESCVDTVRILHQTIVTLRAALEKSRGEILSLKSKNRQNVAVEDTIRNLSIENHILRQKVVNEHIVEEDTQKSVKQTDSKVKLPTKSSEPSFEEEYKQKRVKRSDSRGKLQIKKSHQSKKQTEKNEDNNIHISSDNNLPKQLKSLGKTNTNQLSKSRIVCFSNTYDGENHVSTINSLFIKNLNPAAKSEIQDDFTNSHSHKFDNVNLTEEVNDDNTIRKIPVKSKKQIQFEEELVDNIIISRQGSISEFITEECKSNENQLIQYTECVKQSEKLIKIPQLKQPKQSVKNKQIKDITSKLKNKYPVLKEKQKVFAVSDHIQTRFTEKYLEKDQEILKISDSEDVTSRKLTTEIETENCDNTKSNLKNKLNLENHVKKTEINITTKTEAQDLENNLEAHENKLHDDIVKISSTVSNDEKNKSKELVEIGVAHENQHMKLNIKNQENPQCQINKINTIQEVEIKGANTALDELPKENKELSQQHSVDKGINNTETSSDTTGDYSVVKDTNNTETSTDTTDGSASTKQKNIEISVKIYKRSKRPIEIDIQTKKKDRKKKKIKVPKMNNKSQNTSFDKEYTESTINQLQSTNTEINVDNASADNIVGNILQNDVEQEVDDIELIFTTDDTKETDFKEELVPIDTYAETQLLQCPLSDYEEKLSAETSDRELEDDVFNDNFENENQENSNFQSQTYGFRRENSQIYNSKSDNSINHEDKSLKSYYSYQDSSFENKSLEKDESFDRFEEKVRIIETDISKIGIQDVEYNLGRRNTCPNPIQYRPIIHREALGRGLGSRKCRPVVAHSNVIRKESGVQTDISALPGSSWRSESSLGHKVKVGENFTTLPSKFPHPGSRLRLSEKTVEARRVLLSDIGFTSMVPELSRSADHLFPPTVRGPVVSSYGQFLRTTDLYSPAYTSQKFVWTTTTPSEGSYSQSRYSSQYPLSSPPAPTRRCSAPVSPSKKTVMKNTPSKVRFANGSLPELRGDWTATIDSGESTDSLVEEAEHFLRRSIDCLAPCRDGCYRSDNVKITGVRRASAPEPSRDNVPPQGWQPFLPRIPRDLHLDYWVKVISPEGRVRGGRVRYVGPLFNQPESFVGVQLSTPDGLSDGTYNTRRYFNCEPYHGLFVPFKKIIMGWRP